MKQVSDSLLAFQHMFPDDDACAAWLIEMRWPDGFVCPACGHEKGWALRRKAHTFECAGCRRQTSVTAGTILHASKLPLTVWFWAAYLMATHSNGISALQLQKQLGIGSYRSAWLLAHKLRASMVDPERNPLSGLVEIDEASLPFRTKDDPPTGGQGRSHDGKMLIVGAIELGDGNIPGRLRLAEISSYGAVDLGHFVETAADWDGGMMLAVGTATGEALCLHHWDGGMMLAVGTATGEIYVSEDDGGSWTCMEDNARPVSKDHHHLAWYPKAEREAAMALRRA